MAIDEFLYKEFQSFTVLVIARLSVTEMNWDEEAGDLGAPEALNVFQSLG